MKRVVALRLAGEWNTAGACDRIMLDAGDRRRRRVAMTGENGTEFLLDFATPVALRDGDGLVLDDGAIIQVVGAPESLVEITAADASALARLAWHLGNRHTEVQLVGTKLRIRRDHVLEEMLLGLGAALTPLRALFEPEGGAHGHAHGPGRHPGNSHGG